MSAGAVAMDFRGLPNLPAIAELKTRRQWVAWKYVERDGRLTKPPVNPNTTGGASHSDPSTWGTYDEAVSCALLEGFPGVGYVMVEDDDITGADLDKCRNKDTGEIEPWAQEILALAETYAEVSPSGTGLRLIWRGKVEKTFKADPVHVEVYRSMRYLTITGQHVTGTPQEIRPAPKTAAALWQRVENYRAERERVRSVENDRPATIRTATPATTGGGFFRQVSEAAMKDLGSWVPSLFPQAKYQPGIGSYRVSSRSLGRDLEEDLSIAPSGIVDFGVHDMGDPRDGKRTPLDLVLEYSGVTTAKDAAFWLCERLGRRPVDFGWEEQRPSVFFQGAIEQAGSSAGVTVAPKPIRTFDFATLFLEDVAEEPDLIEPNLLGSGGFLLIGGPPKAQKSWLLQDLLVSAAIGAPFLDGTFTFPRPLRVFWLQAEMNEKLLRRRAKAVTSLNPEMLDMLAANLIVSDRFRMILDPNGVEVAAKLMRESFAGELPDIIAFDPMANIFDQENENDNAQVMRFLTQRIEMVRQLVNPEAGVILVHHATKKGPDEIRKDPFNCFRGGGALRGHYDSGIIIFRKDDVGDEREVHFELRGGDAPDPMTVRLENGRMAKAASVLFGEQPEKGWPDKQTLNAILRLMKEAWDAGKPWSSKKQTRDSGRYAPDLIRNTFKTVTPRVAEEIIQKWLMNGYLEFAERDSHKEMRGLKVLKNEI